MVLYVYVCHKQYQQTISTVFNILLHVFYPLLLLEGKNIELRIYLKTEEGKQNKKSEEDAMKIKVKLFCSWRG